MVDGVVARLSTFETSSTAEPHTWCQGVVPPPQSRLSRKVGGRLKLFRNNWHMVQPDKWVQSIVSQGYLLEFTSTPPRDCPVRQTVLPLDASRRSVLLEEVQKLLLKNAIYRIYPPYQEGFWSTFFLAPKKTGDWRPILNLKPLNAFIKPKKFRMESLSYVLKFQFPGYWATSIDLKDAYLHVPIHGSHHRWLRFMVQGQAYAFRCLPFGLSTAPRVFTRIVRCIGAALRQRGIIIFQYLDDWLILAPTREEVRRHTTLVLQYLELLGFIVNLEKSNLDPSQVPVFLGAIMDLTNSIVRPTAERVDNLLECVHLMSLAQDAPAVAWLRLLGLMASMVDLVPYCRFRMRLIQLQLLRHFRPSRHPLSTMVPMSQVVLNELRWWSQKSNLTVGMHFPCPDDQVVLVTDASLLGWGGGGGGRGSCRQQYGSGGMVSGGIPGTYQCPRDVGCGEVSVPVGTVSGQQESSGQVRQLHSGGLYKQARRNQVPISLSSRTKDAVVVYGPRNSVEGQTHPRCRERSGGQSIAVDINSTHRMVPLEAGLSDTLSAEGVPDDRSLCVSSQSSVTSLLLPRSGRQCVSLRRNVHRLVRDGLIAIISYRSVRISSNIAVNSSSAKDQEGGLLSGVDSSQVAPTGVVPVVVATDGRRPNQFTIGSRHPEDARNAAQVPQRPVPEVDCLDIIQQRYQKEGFSEQVANLVARGRRESTLKVYTSRVRPFIKWCEHRQICPSSAPVTDIAEFLKLKFDEGLQASTVRGYLSAIHAIHLGYENGSSITDSRPLKLLIEGMSNKRPRVRNIWPSWDLPRVLEYLGGPPFEPLQSASLRDLTLKTIFLIAIASGRRCSELHALAIDSFLVFSQDGVTMYFRPSFLAKNERSNFKASPLFLPFITKSKKRSKRLNCPVRALRWYLDRTKTVRGQIQQLFVTTKSPYKAAAKSTLAGWIVDAIAKSGAVSSPSSAPRAHSVRAYSASWAFAKGLSVKEIMNTVSWRTDTTFTKIYLRDLGPRLDHGKYAMAVLKGSQK